MPEAATKAAKLTPTAHALIRQLAFVQNRPHTECLDEAVREWAVRQPQTKTLGLEVSQTQEGN